MVDGNINTVVTARLNVKQISQENPQEIGRELEDRSATDTVVHDTGEYRTHWYIRGVNCWSTGTKLYCQ